MNGDRDRRDLEIERPEAEVERLRERVAHSTAVVRQCLELYVAFNDRAPEVAAVKLEQAGEETKSALSATRNLSMMLRRSETGGGLGKALSVPLETTAPPDVRYEVGDVGMRAMKERAALLGGARRVSSRPNADTKQEVSVPLAEEEVR